MSDPADRRAAERIPVSAGTTCSRVARVVEDLGPVKIRDVSMQGIGLLLMRSVAAGSMLVLTLTNRDKTWSRTMTVQIAHVTPVPGGYVAGGAFVEPLTYQEFVSLVM